MTQIVGLDEAGRGPVIGPMVMCGVKLEEKNQFKLKLLGVKDSKLLSPEQREKLYEILTKELDYTIRVIDQKEIDFAVESDNTNLNWLEGDKISEIINELGGKRIIIDCPSNNKEAFENYVRERIKSKKVEIKTEFKADKKYLVVGAASIIAKVTRDRIIGEIKKKHKIEFGSGYPSDPITRDFIKNNWDKYDIFRKSWATYKNAKKEKSQKDLTNF
jgi:ribonuclease HII